MAKLGVSYHDERGIRQRKIRRGALETEGGLITIGLMVYPRWWPEVPVSAHTHTYTYTLAHSRELVRTSSSCSLLHHRRHRGLSGIYGLLGNQQEIDKTLFCPRLSFPRVSALISRIRDAFPRNIVSLEFEETFRH